MNARSETKIKHHEGIKWENKSTEFLATTSITKSNSAFPTFPSENTKSTGKRGENGEKTGRKGWKMSRKNRETILAPIRSEGLVLATPTQRVVAAAPTRPGHGPPDVTSLTNTLNLHEYMNLYEFVVFLCIFHCHCQVYLILSYVWWYFIRCFTSLHLPVAHGNITYRRLSMIIIAYHTSLVPLSGSWFASSCYRSRGVVYQAYQCFQTQICVVSQQRITQATGLLCSIGRRNLGNENHLVASSKYNLNISISPV